MDNLRGAPVPDCIISEEHAIVSAFLSTTVQDQNSLSFHRGSFQLQSCWLHRAFFYKDVSLERKIKRNITLLCMTVNNPAQVRVNVILWHL